MAVVAASDTLAPVPAPDPEALVPSWLGARAYDIDGVRVGHVADVLFDVATHAPGWVLLALPALDAGLVAAPAAGLRHLADGVQLCVERDAVRCAPRSASPPDTITARHGALLAAHYGLRAQPGPWLGVVDPAVAGVGGRMRAGRAA